LENNGAQLIVLDGLLADEINATIQYVACSESDDNSEHVELHKALMEIHKDFANQLQKRIVFLDHTSVVNTIKESSQCEQEKENTYEGQ